MTRTASLRDGGESISELVARYGRATIYGRLNHATIDATTG